VGPLNGATHYGVAGEPGEGPFVQLWFLVEGETIRRATYKTFGCPTTIASSSLMAELLTGKPVQVALSIEESDIVALIGNVPEGKEDCPRRVVAAIADAFSGEGRKSQS